MIKHIQIVTIAFADYVRRVITQKNKCKVSLIVDLRLPEDTTRPKRNRTVSTYYAKSICCTILITKN